MGGIAIDLCCIRGASAVFHTSWCKSSGLGTVSNQLFFYIWYFGAVQQSWADINGYIELDLRTRMDHRQYFEVRHAVYRFTLLILPQIPALIFTTLCYAFWLSFKQIGSPLISPVIWPLVWLAFTAVVMFDPFRILFKPSRYWLLRNTGRLLLSGTRRVEVRLSCSIRHGIILMADLCVVHRFLDGVRSLR